MSWEVVEIERLSTKIISGGTPKSTKEEYYDGDIPWLRTQEVLFNKIYDTEVKITEEGLMNSSAKMIEVNSVIVAMYGNSAGRVCLNKIPLTTNQACCNIHIDKTKANEEFVFYNLISRYKELKSLSRGAAQSNLNSSDIKKFKIPIPPLPTQKRIADILSAYDDLIENNLKRIKLLEQAAQNIYKEWFVHLRFPGHEKATFDEETGLPEGWEEVNLYDFAGIQMGYSFKAKDFNDEMEGKPAIRIRDILSGWTNTYTTETVADKYNVEHGDILIGMDGIFHMGVWSGQEKALLVQRVCRVRANNKEYQGYLLEALRAPINYYEKTISGATVAHLGAKHLKEIFIIVPDDDLLNRLPIFNLFISEIITLNKQNQKLKEARDILLPRLMNRTIEV